ncbi:unnamed protein product [Agarophyton chilense]
MDESSSASAKSILRELSASSQQKRGRQSLITVPFTLLLVEGVSGSGHGNFWQTRLSVSSFLVSAVGWALFTLLGFLVKEAAARRREAQDAWVAVETYTRQIARQLVQIFPAGTWHDGDRERMEALLASYPLALALLLGGMKNVEQGMKGLLCTKDFAEIRADSEPHLACSRVVRAYVTAAETACEEVCGLVIDGRATGSEFARNFIGTILDRLDESSSALFRIAEFYPSKGYINHLRLFMYIWCFFVPLSFVAENGWFTPIWSVSVVYGVGSVFEIASRLNNPFGYDYDDINLEILGAEASLGVISVFENEAVELDDVLSSSTQEKENAESWSCLETELPHSLSAKLEISRWDFRLLRRVVSLFKSMPLPHCSRLARKSVLIPLVFHITWTVISVVLSWVASRSITSPNRYNEKCFWWCTYIGPHPRTTLQFALALFLLLGFWVMDAYSRYWNGLLLWSMEMRSSLNVLAIHFATSCRNGLWHPRDRERIFSFLATVPYVLTAKLRDSRDFSSVRNIISKHDFRALCSAKDPSDYLFHVIYGYLNSAIDPARGYNKYGTSPFRESIFNLQQNAWRVEDVIRKCQASRRFPLSPILTRHVRSFLIIWLIILPISMAGEHGFLTILYSVLLGYCIINLAVLGSDLQDPFGMDPDDLPLNDLCDEMRDVIQSVHNVNSVGMVSIARSLSYSRKSFGPFSILNPEIESDLALTKHDFRWFCGKLKLELWRIGSKFWSFVPRTNRKAFAASVLWSTLGTFIFYASSFPWDQENCNRPWRCSPIQIDGIVLSYTGLALFILLGFRAQEALGRFESRICHFYKLESELRFLALQFVQAFPSHTWHVKDKERIVAHIVQIPVSFQDELLENGTALKNHGLLSVEDQQASQSSSSTVQCCIEVLERYLISIDATNRDPAIVESNFSAPSRLVRHMLDRLTRIRLIISFIRTMNKYPVVRGITKHQHVFTGVWLFLLPLGLVADSGFYGILWSSIISYAVLCLDSLAFELLESREGSSIELQKQLCSRIIGTVLEAVDSVKWSHKYHVLPVFPEAQAFLGLSMEDGTVRSKHTLVELGIPSKKPFEEKKNSLIRPPKQIMKKKTFFHHFLCSVPWWWILAAETWTIVVVLLSYQTKNDGSSDQVRWWVPSAMVDEDAAVYFSFATLVLIAFYMQIGLNRYREAGLVWRDNLRSQCHALLALWFNLFPSGTWHRGDHDRITSHIVAIPIVLKMELRKNRDIRELKGIFSQQDLGRILCAENMTWHCIDVIRSYFLSAAAHMSSLEIPCKILGTKRRSKFRAELCKIENSIATCMFIKNAHIAPPGQILLRFLLGSWIALFPFIVIESAGWMTIIVVPLVAYGLFGLYKITNEIKDPFGTDLNDFDLDELAAAILRDLHFMQQNYFGGFKTLVRASGEEEPYGSRALDIHSQDMKEEHTLQHSLWSSLKLAAHFMSFRLFFVLGVWSVIITWLSSVIPPVSPVFQSHHQCGPWWCSSIALQSKIFKFSGFALFMLLSKRLYEMHYKYVFGLIQIRQNMTILSRLVMNRTFASTVRGSWHEGDFKRIAAHMSGYLISAAAELRNWEYFGDETKQANTLFRTELENVMTAADVSRVIISEEPAEYCLDVITYYLISRDYESRHKTPPNELRIIMGLLSKLQTILGNCKALQRECMPFGYVMHLRVFMSLWILLLPLGLVESSGWFTPPLVLLIAFGIIGVERWSEELRNPFGLDISDVPLNALKAKALAGVFDTYRTFCENGGATSLIHKDRGGHRGGACRELIVTCRQQRNVVHDRNQRSKTSPI